MVNLRKDNKKGETILDFDITPSNFSWCLQETTNILENSGIYVVTKNWLPAPILTRHTEVAFGELATEQLFTPLLAGPP